MYSLCFARPMWAGLPAQLTASADVSTIRHYASNPGPRPTNISQNSPFILQQLSWHRSPVLISPLHGWMTRLSWPGWLI